jgi:hypothetical protein
LTKGSIPANGGIEQPVWDKKTRRFYLTIPTTLAHTNGEVDEIDPVKMTITNKFACDSPILIDSRKGIAQDRPAFFVLAIDPFGCSFQLGYLLTYLRDLPLQNDRPNSPRYLRIV